jgi:hypothetical protein
MMRSLVSIVRCFVFASALLGFARPAAGQTDFYVYAVTAKLVAQMTVVGPVSDVVVTRKLGNAEIINLALGRPLTTKIDKKTEILAGAGTYADHALESKLIVFDPSQNGLAQIKAVVGTIASADFTTGYFASKSAGVGFGTANFAATTLGNPAQNGFLPWSGQGSGGGSGSHDPFGGNSKVSGKGTASGRIRFVYTDASGTHTFDGIIAKGQAKASGKPIGAFTQ